MCLLLPLISGRGSWAACLISVSVSLLTTWREWRPHPSQDGGVLFARASTRVVRTAARAQAPWVGECRRAESGRLPRAWAATSRPRRWGRSGAPGGDVRARAWTSGLDLGRGALCPLWACPAGRVRPEVEGQEGCSAEQAAADPRGKPSDPCGSAREGPQLHFAGRGVSLGTALAWPAGRWDFSPFSLALLAGATAPGPRTVLTRHRPCPSLVICCSIDCFSDSCCLVLRRPKPR